MKKLSVDFVLDRMLDIIAHMQLNEEYVPVLDNELIHQIAEEFIYEWENVGDFEADFDSTLHQFLVYEFNKNFF